MSEPTIVSVLRELKEQLAAFGPGEVMDRYDAGVADGLSVAIDLVEILRKWDDLQRAWGVVRRE